ncbi:relaxase/mobilization nuclease domain-containing protein [Mucilaginibacter sp. SMC90]|uniref:relaxase/mobilization nuclease domain-containing protein n=1 Tax=Mucilaginibacter sp. SMC90 TaxID=2929803 RepID=UPI001FB24C1E|nr:relaxase/mobilization nuclease domain-containing protein [Mucilaginibacter sp. SMC90]UOE51305.1 relaxase/mobilization nuclease domain-containing protein [Mucilaginibacter sp. SMC90]
MVTIIRQSKSIKATFYYNENKMKEGVAECFMAENYPLELAKLTEQDRLKMLEKMSSLNKSIYNCLHVTLNFDPSEDLSRQQLQEITRDYMDKIGFGNQPYLVYQHYDAGHPHVHVLSTNIQMNGKAIGFHDLYKKSEPARKELEQRYGLVKAEGKNALAYELKPLIFQKASYGKTETKRAINTVLKGILSTYHYTSLPELNAVLGLYNVMADKGTEGSRTLKNNGLVYRVLDSFGNPIGVPIKASVFFGNPGLKYLESQFAKNENLRSPHKTRIKNAIDLAIIKEGSIGLKRLIQVLSRDGIDVVLRQNKDGLLYGITYVDHKKKCVFNGNDLGKAYSATAILQRCSPIPPQAKEQTTKAIKQPLKQAGAIRKSMSSDATNTTPMPSTPVANPADKSLLEELMQAEYNNNYLPYELRKTRKKRKKRSTHL